MLGCPLHELSGRTVDLDDLIGRPAGTRLLDRLRTARGWAGRFALLDRFLANSAAAGPVPAREIAFAWKRLSTAGAAVRVGALANEVGWSHKHLISQFHRQVGLSPRTVARITRFNTLLRHLDQTPAPVVRWGDLAQACGYYDQAHLDRDFRQFAGTTPTDFLTRRGAGGTLVGDGLPGHEVKSVQDVRPRQV